MKKKNSLTKLALLAFVIYACIFTLISCVEVKTPDTTEQKSDTTVTTTKENTEANLPTVTENTPSTTTKAPATTTKAPATTTAPAKFEEVTAVDNNECVIKIKGLSDTILGLSLKIELENKSQEKTYMFTIEDLSINGVECSAFLAEDVAPTKKAISSVIITTDALEEAGIKEYTDIKIKFRVYDTNDWLSDDVALKSVHVYPLGEEKAVKYIREAKEGDIVIVDNEFVKAVITGYHNDILLGYGAKLYIENKTDGEAMFSVDESSVNGFMADPYFVHILAAGTCAFTDISWYSSTLEEIGITEPQEEITNIEFIFKAQDYSNLLGDKYCEELVKIDK